MPETVRTRPDTAARSQDLSQSSVVLFRAFLGHYHGWLQRGACLMPLSAASVPRKLRQAALRIFDETYELDTRFQPGLTDRCCTMRLSHRLLHLIS